MNRCARGPEPAAPGASVLGVLCGSGLCPSIRKRQRRSPRRAQRTQRTTKPSLFKETASAVLRVLGALCGSGLCPSIRKRKGKGIHHGGHRAHRERPSLFFSKKRPLPFFAFFAPFAVQAVSSCRSICNLQSAICNRVHVSVPAKSRLTSFDPPRPPFLARSFPQNGLGASARACDPRKC